MDKLSRECHIFGLQSTSDGSKTDFNLQDNYNGSVSEQDLIPSDDSLHTAGTDTTIASQDLCSLPSQGTMDMDNDSDNDDDLYYIDFDNVTDKHIAIWSYVKPDEFHLFKPPTYCTLGTLSKFSLENLDYRRNMQKLTFLFPREKDPLDTEDVVNMESGSCVLILPKQRCVVTVVIDKTDTIFELEVDLTAHVFRLKQVIEREQGLSTQQQDLVHQGRCLQNHRRLYEYSIRSQSILYLQIQYRYNMVVSVKTFWKAAYDLFVDPCMHVDELVEIVIKRCISPNLYGEMSVLGDFMIPSHLLILEVKGQTLSRDRTIGSYNIHHGDMLHLTTVGRQHKVNLKAIEVGYHDGHAARLYVSQFDTWAIVAFHMHGVTGIPFDKIRIFKQNKMMDFMMAVGIIGEDFNKIEMRPLTARKKTSAGKEENICMQVNLGRTVIETLSCSPNESVKDVKGRLEDMGIPNAMRYQLTSKHQAFDDSMVLKNLVGNKSQTLKVTLHLEKFPLSVHCPDNQDIVVNIQGNQTIASVKKTIQQRTKYYLKSNKLLLAGQDFTESDNTLVYHSPLHVGMLLYLEPKSMSETVLVYSDQQVTKLRIRSRTSSGQIRQTLWKAKIVPGSSLASLETFFNWHYSLTGLADRSQRGSVKLGRYLHNNRCHLPERPIQKQCQKLQFCVTDMQTRLQNEAKTCDSGTCPTTNTSAQTGSLVKVGHPSGSVSRPRGARRDRRHNLTVNQSVERQGYVDISAEMAADIDRDGITTVGTLPAIRDKSRQDSTGNFSDVTINQNFPRNDTHNQIEPTGLSCELPSVTPVNQIQSWSYLT